MIAGEYIKGLIILLLPYSSLLSFIAGFITEDALLFIALLSGSGLISLYNVMIFGFIGILVHDYIAYLIARSKTAGYLKKKLRLFEKPNRFNKFIRGLGKNGYLAPLIISKFVYGTRVALILFVSHSEKSHSNFILNNALASGFWCIIMLPLGWLAGKGFLKLLHIVKGIEKILAVLLAFAIVVYFIQLIIRKAINKKINSKQNKA